MFSKLVLSSALIVCFLSFAYAKHQQAEIQDCGSVTGSIIKVDIVGCDNHDRCPLKRGSNATLTASFKSNDNSNSLKAVVYGWLGPIKSRFNLPNPDACTSGVACPLRPDQSYSYHVSIPIKAGYPQINVDIQLELIDANGKDVICALIPAQIVNKSYVN